MSLAETQIVQIRDDIATDLRCGIQLKRSGREAAADIVEYQLQGMRAVIRRLGEDSLLSCVDDALNALRETRSEA